MTLLKAPVNPGPLDSKHRFQNLVYLHCWLWRRWLNCCDSIDANSSIALADRCLYLVQDKRQNDAGIPPIPASSIHPRLPLINGQRTSDSHKAMMVRRSSPPFLLSWSCLLFCGDIEAGDHHDIGLAEVESVLQSSCHHLQGFQVLQGIYLKCLPQVNCRRCRL